MNVDKYKLHYPRDADVQKAQDGSVRIMWWRKTVSDKEPLELRGCNFTYIGGNCRDYTLRVNFPDDIVLDWSAYIIRSSANCYKLLYSDNSKTQLMSLSNYDEINKSLRTLSPKQ